MDLTFAVIFIACFTYTVSDLIRRLNGYLDGDE